MHHAFVNHSPKNGLAIVVGLALRSSFLRGLTMTGKEFSVFLTIGLAGLVSGIAVVLIVVLIL
jgi:hypothetical protein